MCTASPTVAFRFVSFISPYAIVVIFPVQVSSDLFSILTGDPGEISLSG